jgi:hypothetical protein
VKKWLPVVVGVVLAAAVLVPGVMQLHAYRQKLARARLIDRAHFDRIKEGISRAEVEDILGGPQGYYSTETVFSCVHAPPPALGGGDRWETWIGNDGEINVVFDEQDAVRWRDFAPPIRPSSVAGRLLAWLRRVWP